MSDPQIAPTDDEDDDDGLSIGLIVLCVVLILLVIVAIAIIICLFHRYKYRPKLAAIFTRPVKRVLKSRHTTRSHRANLLSIEGSDQGGKTEKWVETHVKTRSIPVHTPHSLTFGAVVDANTQPPPQQHTTMVRSAQHHQQQQRDDLTIMQDKVEAVVVEPTHLFQYYVQTKEGKAHLLARDHIQHGHHSGAKRDFNIMPMWRSMISRRSKKRLSGNRSDIVVSRHSVRGARSNTLPRRSHSHWSDPGVLRDAALVHGGGSNTRGGLARLSHLEIRPERHVNVANGIGHAAVRSNLGNNTTHAYTLQGGAASLGGLYNTQSGYSIDRYNSAANMQLSALPSRASQWGMGHGDFTISGRNVTVSY